MAGGGAAALPLVRPLDVWLADQDLKGAVEHHEQKVHGARGWQLARLAFSALGIVFGDLGTSCIYTLAAVYGPPGTPLGGCVLPSGSDGDATAGVCTALSPAEEARVLGVLSMVFWALTLVVLVKYVGLVLLADNNGEGGTFALHSLICRAANIGMHSSGHGGLARLAGQGVAGRMRGWLEGRRGAQLGLLVTVIVAASMVMSDGMLTPAISVISAVEGLRFTADISQGAVLLTTCAILATIFLLQSNGTARVSFLFSPVILLWLLAIGGIGLFNTVVYRPGVVRGLSPHYIWHFFQGDPHWAWQKLGKIMLAITGAEALYADLGHFSRPAIQLSFILVVYPCLVLTYLGQTAFILDQPEAAASAFWASQPAALKYPMVVLATLAAVIASQALITGTFSIVQQAVSMSCFPRVAIKHTSRDVRGQVYIPAINAMLAFACTALVLIFQSSAAMGNAYGLAVSIVEVATTSLLALLMLIGWGWHPVLVAAFWAAATLIEGAFLSSNLAKIRSGAWFSLLLAGLLVGVSLTWHWGQALKQRHLRAHAVLLQNLLHVHAGEPPAQPQDGPKRDEAAPAAPLSEPAPAGRDGSAPAVRLQPGPGGGPELRLVSAMDPFGPPVARLPGVGLYYSEVLSDAPPTLVHFLRRCVPALHEVVIILTVRYVPLPHVAQRDQLLLRKLCLPGFYHAVVRYGYMDTASHDKQFVQGILQAILSSSGASPADGPTPLLSAPDRAQLQHRAARSGHVHLELPVSDSGDRSPRKLGAAAGGSAGSGEGTALLADAQDGGRSHHANWAAAGPTGAGTGGGWGGGRQRELELTAHMDSSWPSSASSYIHLDHQQGSPGVHGSPSKAAASAASWASSGINNSGAGGCWLSPGLLEEGPGSAASWEQECLERACLEGPMSHFLGRSALAAAPSSPWLKALVLRLYSLLSATAHSAPANFNIPPEALVELGFVYEV